MKSCTRSAEDKAGAIKKEDTIIKIQNQKKQFVCLYLPARITMRDTHISMYENASRFPRKTRASSISPMECTRAKTIRIFLSEKTAPGVIRYKNAQVTPIIMANVSRGKLVKTTIMNHQEEIGVTMS